MRVTRFADLPRHPRPLVRACARTAIEATVTDFTAAFSAFGIEGPIIRLDQKLALHDMAPDSLHAPLEL